MDWIWTHTHTHTSFRVFENLVFHCNTNLYALLIVWRFESMRLCVAFSLLLFNLDKTQCFFVVRAVPLAERPNGKVEIVVRIVQAPICVPAHL